ncbi:archaetidylserine decarboxylase [Aurantiacibacter poecillastricola]|uniref:archaetidylserine decarboxylase n=1 Tax=Aurantiacibacter poecillastricola TaxID=3064385 RepID=UPI00273D9BED|nr:archaetidylserine decarboxylase [Aurantiacibacter sp. 219JJ12-13]MDP5262814.1 archaetidylserine decarboxylase [Aurantiacibacter sp. 219JJ12-13]
MGWFARVELPPVRAASIAAWKFFCDVDMSDARSTSFKSLREAFIRPLREGARPLDTAPVAISSPCDGIVGAFGRIEDGTALQIKGMPYPVADLLGSEEEAKALEGGWYVTLRLTAGMYHRFHAPHDIAVEQLRYISGDTWNVNPIALKRVERLFCKNERAPITVRLESSGKRLVLVPVAAVLVASIRLPWYDETGDVRRKGERVENLGASFVRGEEMGWFEHGSTIVVLSPPECPPAPGLETGQTIRMGERLMVIDE